jgi:N-acetylneuraminic acid mutarotase
MMKWREITLCICVLLVAPHLWAQDEWNQTASLTQARHRHTATLLDDGRLLVTGGAYDFWGETATATCEIYDPSTGTWSAAAAMNAERSSHTATLLPDGRVLVTGGFAGGGYALSSAEIYDPTTNTWTAAASMGLRRYRHHAIALNGDSVLIVGGRQGNIDGYGSMDIWGPVSSCEIYDVVNDTWSTAGSMNQNRVETGLALLPDGRVLAAGGINSNLYMDIWAQPATATCEIYDPVTNTWSYTDSLNSARNYVRLVTMDDNSVLSIGGELGMAALKDCRLFNVDSSQWTAATELNNSRIISEAVKLPGGDVMTVGGWSYLWSAQTGTTEIYRYDGGAWDSLPSLEYPRGWHTATLLNTGEVIAVGGTSDHDALSSCEIFGFGEQGTLIAYASSDVPGDEGGQVRLFFTSHRNDVAGAADRVTTYDAFISDPAGNLSLPGYDGTWRMVGTVNATGRARYSVVVPSTADGKACRYIIVANTKSGTITPSGTVDATSYDNRGPLVTGLRVAKEATSHQVMWAASPSADINAYAVYRGSTPDFAIEPSARIAVTTDLQFADQNAGGARSYYRIVGIDRAGNGGPGTPAASATSSNVPGDASTGAAFRVGSNYPQPFSLTTQIPLELDAPMMVGVKVYDGLGRQVAVVAPRLLDAGSQRVEIDGGSLVSGSYTCVVRAGGASKAIQLVVRR